MDFQALKDAAGIEQAVAMLNLKLTPRRDQLRGRCPACASSNDRSLVVTPSKGAFYCFSAGTGGDQLSLIAHVRGIGVRQAAEELAQHVGFGEAPKETKGFDPASYAETLDYEAAAQHVKDAKRYGIGYATRGVYGYKRDIM